MFWDSFLKKLNISVDSQNFQQKGHAVEGFVPIKITLFSLVNGKFRSYTHFQLMSWYKIVISKLEVY